RRLIKCPVRDEARGAGGHAERYLSSPDRAGADTERLGHLVYGEKFRHRSHHAPPPRLTAAVEPKVCADVQASMSEKPGGRADHDPLQRPIKREVCRE